MAGGVAEFARIRACSAIPRTLASSATSQRELRHSSGLGISSFVILAQPFASFSTPLPIRYTAPRRGQRSLAKGVIMGAIDILVFVAFVISVIFIGLWKSTGEETHSEHGAQDYFLAGRGLTWWLIGFSLIAANISTEQFVGMSGKAADWLGMAIASYEWMAAITLVVVAFLFLPTFLKSGIYTIPEFLEYRYNTFARTVMALCTMVILVGVPTASVIYSGAKVITGNFQGVTLYGFDLGNITVGCWIIGVLSAIYVFAGGLKACAWADLIQGTALILGGAGDRGVRFELAGRQGPAGPDPNGPKPGSHRRVAAERRPDPTVLGPEQRPAARRQDPHGARHQGQGNPLDGADRRPVDSQLLLLGPEPVHHATDAGLEVAGRGPAGDRVRRLPQADYPLYRRHSRDPGLQPVSGPIETRRGEPQRADPVRVLAGLVPFAVRRDEAGPPSRPGTRTSWPGWTRICGASPTPAKPYVYKFDAVFAGLHAQDAAAVVAHDLRQVEGS